MDAPRLVIIVGVAGFHSLPPSDVDPFTLQVPEVCVVLWNDTDLRHIGWTPNCPVGDQYRYVVNGMLRVDVNFADVSYLLIHISLIQVVQAEVQFKCVLGQRFPGGTIHDTLGRCQNVFQADQGTAAC